MSRATEGPTTREQAIAASHEPSRPPPSLRADLRAATAEAHHEAERCAALARLSDGSLSIDHYRRLLQRFAAFYRPAERALVRSLRALSPRLDYTPKLPRLEADLQELGAVAPARDWAPETFTTAPAGGLALLYVLEGSTLGAKVLTARVRDTLGPAVGGATRFLDPYGATCRDHWAATCRFLDEAARAIALDHDAVARHAIALFSSLTACLDAQSTEPVG